MLMRDPINVHRIFDVGVGIRTTARLKALQEEHDAAKGNPWRMLYLQWWARRISEGSDGYNLPTERRKRGNGNVVRV
jgi:hypothetical protein